jgi:hypothetical protein
MNLDQLFSDIDDHVKALSSGPNSQFLTSKKTRRGNAPLMSLSEIMTIIIWYHSSGFKNFKMFYFYIQIY